MMSPSFEVAQRVGTIVLGQIVVDEVCNKYRENLEDKAAKRRKAIRDFNDPLFTPHIAWNEPDVSDECNKYKDFLEMFIIESGMTIAEPYPNDAHEIMKNYRMNAAAGLLKNEKDLKVADIAGLVGYDSPSKFASAFKKEIGRIY